jgi:hypothetical protein
MCDQLLIADNHSVAGIVPTLKTHHDVSMFGE